MPISGDWRLHANNPKCNMEAEMPTVKVTFSWFSSNPVFPEVLAVVKKEIAEKKVLVPEFVQALEDLLPFNGGEPIKGFTEFGPHTYINFEAPSLAKAVFAAQALQFLLQHKFLVDPVKDPHRTDFSAKCFRYNGKTLPEFIAGLESVNEAAREAEQDLKGTRRFLPSKKIQALRLAIQDLRR